MTEKPLKWHAFTTVKRQSDFTWAYVGTNEIELTGADDPEIPTFTAAELAELRGP